MSNADPVDELRSIDGRLTGRLLHGVGYCMLVHEVPSPLEIILRDIIRTVEAKLFYIAVAISLSVPDICARMELDPARDVQVKGSHYIAWWEANVMPQLPALTGVDAYRLRCGVLHQGSFGHPKNRFDHVVFTLPGTPNRAHGCISAFPGGINERCLLLDVGGFCWDVITGARRWAEAKADDANVIANMPHLVRFRPEGLPPFFSGTPVIA